MPDVAERRNHRRFNLALPVQVRFPGAPEQQETSTKDISAGGIYFSLSRDLAPGSELECVMTLPREICQGNSIQVRCLGRIVRVEPGGTNGPVGVAATIEKYQFLRISQ